MDLSKDCYSVELSELGGWKFSHCPEVNEYMLSI
jgi:hypothetical protein